MAASINASTSSLSTDMADAINVCQPAIAEPDLESSMSSDLAGTMEASSKTEGDALTSENMVSSRSVDLWNSDLRGHRGIDAQAIIDAINSNTDTRVAAVEAKIDALGRKVDEVNTRLSSCMNATDARIDHQDLRFKDAAAVAPKVLKNVTQVPTVSQNRVGTRTDPRKMNQDARVGRIFWLLNSIVTLLLGSCFLLASQNNQHSRGLILHKVPSQMAAHLDNLNSEDLSNQRPDLHGVLNQKPATVISKDDVKVIDIASVACKQFLVFLLRAAEFVIDILILILIYDAVIKTPKRPAHEPVDNSALELVDSWTSSEPRVCQTEKGDDKDDGRSGKSIPDAANKAPAIWTSIRRQQLWQ